MRRLRLDVELMTMHSHNISDQALIRAAHPSTESERYYTAVYRSGKTVTFAVGHSEAARVFAIEYGVRFLDGDKVVSVRWQR